ncbi:MAG: DUF1778 domain-containing protein, partial [Actinomycetota bacterium]|nr:DUF1778 domain-containing protein [Actinomycetota bacterium]
MEMAIKTRRLETRVDPDTKELISEAARLNRESVSAFMVRAARGEGDRVPPEQTPRSSRWHVRRVVAIVGRAGHGAYADPRCRVAPARYSDVSEFFRDPLTEGHSCEALARGQRVLDAWLRSEALR